MLKIGTQAPIDIKVTLVKFHEILKSGSGTKKVKVQKKGKQFEYIYFFPIIHLKLGFLILFK